MKSPLWNIAFLILLAASTLTIYLSETSAYSVGVRNGQQATYNVAYTAGDEFLLGSGVTGNVSKIRFEIVGVNQLNVTEKYYYIYSNGTQQLGMTLTFNTRWCNYFSRGPNIVIAANLMKGDSLCDYDDRNYVLTPTNAFTVNETVQYYVGNTLRIADLFLMNDNYGGHLSVVYDRATGMIIESTFLEGGTSPSIFLVVNLVDTNIFPGASPTWSLSYLLLLPLGLTAVIMKTRSTRRHPKVGSQKPLDHLGCRLRLVLAWCKLRTQDRAHLHVTRSRVIDVCSKQVRKLQLERSSYVNLL